MSLRRECTCTRMHCLLPAVTACSEQASRRTEGDRAFSSSFYIGRRGFGLLVLLYLSPHVLHSQETSSQVRHRSSVSLLALDDELQALAARVEPSVVKIEVAGLAEITDPNAPRNSLVARQQGVGSGIIVDANGFVLTNAHVVEHAVTISVLLDVSSRFGSKSSVTSRRLAARIVGKDTLTDIALLKVEAADLPALVLAKPESVHVGQVALAFGSPLGFENTVTFGVVSAVHRQLNVNSPVSYLQTDASINPGNSGGPLVDVHGNVIGMNTMIASESGGNEGVGFSIPSDTLSYVYHQLRSIGHVRRGTIGVVARAVTPELALGLHLPQSTGVLLEDVLPGSSADNAGLRPGDVVVSLDHNNMPDPSSMSTSLFSKQIGEVVSFRIARDPGSFSDVPVTIARRPRDVDNLLDPDRLEGDIVAKLGIIAVGIDAEIAKLVPEQRKPGGLLIVALTAGGTGSSLGLQAADIVYEFNTKKLDSTDSLRKELAALKANTPAVLQIERDGVLRYVVFTNAE